MEAKTNAMRILDKNKIVYKHYVYDAATALSGVEVADRLHQNPAQVFKTLVTVGKSKQHYVYMIPVAQELDLKKAAECAGEKSVEMVKSKALLPLTGYIHGGCSPIGMKKVFPTFIDESAQNFESIIFSGGKIGCQVELALRDLQKVVSVKVASLI